MELNKHVNIWKVDKLMAKKLFVYLFMVNHHIYQMIEIVENDHPIMQDVDVHHYRHHVIIHHQDVWEIVIVIVEDIMIDEVDIHHHREIIDVDNHHRHPVDVLVRVVIRLNHQRKKNVDIHDQVQVNRNK
jgi:hypothetical protein